MLRAMGWVAAAALLASCAAEEPAPFDGWQVIDDALAPEVPAALMPPPPVMHTTGLVPGAAATFWVDAAPGIDVTFVVSTGGEGSGPCHPVAGVCLDMVAPYLVLGTRTTDAFGRARIGVSVPGTVAPGTEVWMQAFLSDGVGTLPTAVTSTQVLGITGSADAFSVDVHWTGAWPTSDLDVTVHDPLGRTSWSFGMAETSAGGAGWYGEDCYLGTGPTALCHGFTGTSLHLDQVSSIGGVVEGSTTLLWTDMDLTYYLSDGATCYTWGHDPSYYAPLGCTVLPAEYTSWGRRSACAALDPWDAGPLGGRVALTFDDGPDTVITPQILATLRAYSVPATFFMVGTQIANPAAAPIIADIAADPLFEIGNHSWDHSDLAGLSTPSQRAQIEDTNAVLAGHGVTPTFFRFPYGSSDCDAVDLVRGYGHISTGWHVDNGDWCFATGTVGQCTQPEYWRIPPAYATDMRGLTMAQVRDFDGGVVLLHDIHAFVAAELEDLILDVLAEGYTFAPLDEVASFPRLNTDLPFDFPLTGEACDTSNDQCWQTEWRGWCEPTGDPGLPATAGVCVVPCEQAYCSSRPGTAPLFCAETSPGIGTCLAQATAINASCDDVPGTVETTMTKLGSPLLSASVCKPWAW